MGYQDLTTYVEVDPGTYITVTETKVTANIYNTQDAYLYYNFGEDFFDDVDIDFELYGDAVGVLGAMAILGLSNKIDDAGAWSTYIQVIMYEAAGTNLAVRLRVGGSYDVAALANDILYYCTLKRAAGNDTAYLYIYSDESRETLVDTLTQTGCNTNKYQYFYALASYNELETRNFQGYYQNINLNLNASPSIIGAILGILAPTIGLYDTRYKLRSRQRDTALTTRVRNT
jgi:hypothetical protein